MSYYFKQLIDKLDWVEGFEYAIAVCTPNTGMGICVTKQSYELGSSNQNQDQVRKESKDDRKKEKVTPLSIKEKQKKIQNDEVQEDFRKDEYELQDKIEELKRGRELDRINTLQRIQGLERENKQLIQRNKSLEERDMDFTRKMSKLTDAKGHFENVNDEFNNTRLSQKFESLYSNQWVLLSGWMAKNFRDKPELEIISFLTKLMKMGYDECEIEADEQVCSLLKVDTKDDVDEKEDLSEFVQFRRKYAVKDSVRGRIKSKILGKIVEMDDVRVLFSREKGKMLEKKFHPFLEAYLDLCWLMSVSNPPMMLEFDVVGKQYVDCKDNFKEYSAKRAVEDMTKHVGTIYEVVWPCVQRKDKSAIYMKGDVVVVKKGLMSNNNDLEQNSLPQL